MLRFSLFGFPIAIHWFFWVNTALFGGGLSANSPEEVQRLIIWVLAAFVSILIHELGHTFFMRRYGARASILLYAFGGLAIPDRRFTRVQDIIVSLAGPLVQIVFGFAAGLFATYLSTDIITVRVFLNFFSYISVLWGVLNLVPIFPLDGGHILNGILGPRRIKTTFTVGIICAVGLGLLALLNGSIISALFCGVLAYENYQRLNGKNPSSMLHPS